MFRTISLGSDSCQSGQTYLYGFNTGIIFVGKIDGGFSFITSQSASLSYDTIYSSKIIADGTNYDFYFDDVLLFSDISLTQFTQGSMGIRFYGVTATLYTMDMKLIDSSSGKSYQSIGPYVDAESRAMTLGGSSTGYTPDSCFSCCLSNGYEYFALQHYQGESTGSHCFCENDFSHATQYGIGSCDQYGDDWCNFIYQIVQVGMYTVNIQTIFTG